MKRLASLALLLLTPILAIAEPYPDTQSPEQAAYTSPYQFASSLSDPSLIADFSEDPRAFTNWQNWSLTNYENWYNFEVIQALDSTWGPYFKPIAAPVDVQSKTTSWMQERVVAAASTLRNTVPYGHHHIQVWDVPNTPEWTDAGYEPGYGIDCSDFTHFAYNYGLGIQLKTAVATQAAMTSAEMYLNDGTIIMIEPEHLFDVRDGALDYASLVSQLQAGDLLYIRGDPGLQNPITHTIMWMGDLAYDDNGIHQYLVMDSHGAVVHDSNGNLIPSGPELRPFLEESYYFGSFDHVERYLPLNVIPEPNTTAFLVFGGISLSLLAYQNRKPLKKHASHRQP